MIMDAAVGRRRQCLREAPLVPRSLLEHSSHTRTTHLVAAVPPLVRLRQLPPRSLAYRRPRFGKKEMRAQKRVSGQIGGT